MRTFDPTPFWRSTVGFDRLFDLMDQAANWSTDDNYPPYNIERTGEDQYRISLALAGFSPDEVSITAEQNVLTVELFRFEVSGFGFDDVACEFEHVLGHVCGRNIVEIIGLVAHLIGIAQQGAHQAFTSRLQSDDVFAASQDDTRPSATIFMSSMASRITPNASAPTLPSGAM